MTIKILFFQKKAKKRNATKKINTNTSFRISTSKFCGSSLSKVSDCPCALDPMPPNGEKCCDHNNTLSSLKLRDKQLLLIILMK